MTLRRLTLVTLLPFLIGCSTTYLSVNPLPKDTSNNAPQGAVYFLPMVEFGLEHQRELLRCPGSSGQVEIWLRAEIKALRALGKNLDVISGGSQPLTKDNLKTRLHLDDADLRILEPLLNQYLEQKANRRLLPEENLLPMRRALVELLLDDGFAGYESLQTVKVDTLLAELPTLKWPAIDERLQELAKSLPQVTTAPRLEVGHAVTSKAHYYPDQERGYAIDHLHLANGLKETDLTLDKYSNGTLKSINATITDRTAEVVGSSVRAALRIAAAFGGVPLPAVPAATTDTESESEVKSQDARAPRKLADVLLCKASILDLLKQRQTAQRELEPALVEIRVKQRKLEAAEKKLGELKTALKAAEAHLAALKEDDPKRPAAVKDVEAKKTAVKDQEKVVNDCKKEKKTLETKNARGLTLIASLRKQLTHTQVQTFRLDGTPPRQDEIGGVLKAGRAWFENTSGYCAAYPQNCFKFNNQQMPVPLRAYVAAYLPPGVQFVSAGSKTIIDPKKSASASHLIYREPARGDLLVCKQEACLDANGNRLVKGENLVKSEPSSFPQLGALATLPLQNGSFQNNTIVAQFAESGSLTHFEYKSNARAQAAAAALEAAAGEIDKFAQAQRDVLKIQLESEKDEITAEKDKVKAQLELEQALEDLEAFRNGELMEEEDEAEEPEEPEEENGQE